MDGPRFRTGSGRRTGAFLCLVLFLVLPAVAAAQVEITPFGGWQMGGSLDSDRGDLLIPAAVNYGIALGYRVRVDGTIELIYNRQDSSLRLRESEFEEKSLTDMSVEYFHFGGAYDPLRGRVRPFVGFSLGATRFASKEGNRSDDWRFSASLAGGAKIPLASRFWLRPQGRFWFTFMDSSSQWFCLLPGECIISVQASTVIQFDASLGLVIAFD